MSNGPDTSGKASWKPATKAVRGGLMRSEHGEISEHGRHFLGDSRPTEIR